ncbi:MAG: tetratricopeptide repeat protein [Rubrivivax sp.]
MATQLDLQEQEQLDAFKAFWNKHGNLITWALVLVLVVYASWNGWNYWQRQKAQQAGAMFEELDRAVIVGDAAKAGRIFTDLRDRFPGTAYAEQAGLAAASVQAANGQADAARESLRWVADHAAQDDIKTIALLRLAGWQAEAKQTDEALKTLDGATAPAFEALVADRRGDLLILKGKPDEAKSAYQRAWAAMSDRLDYRRVIEAKLAALGAAPVVTATAVATGASAVASGAKP